MQSMSSGGPNSTMRGMSLVLLISMLTTLVLEAYITKPGHENMRISTKTKRFSAVATAGQDTETAPELLALLTFNLDDTLFPIGPVVQDANDAMIRAMHKLGYTKSANKNVLKHTTAIRKRIRHPITYTSLRMRAIQAELESQLPKEQTVDPSVVKYCFDARLNELHASAERNLFPGAIEMLETVSAQHPDACIAAITNGRGNPKYMDSISHFFEFCVSGEDDGVFPARKPQRGIYEASLARYKESYPHLMDEPRIWCHVGDCLANDVGASVDCGAYGVWMDADHEAVTYSNDKQPVWSTASKRTMRDRERLKREAKNKVSAKITHLSELPSAIDLLMEKAAWQQHTFV